jgi:AraC-like DNA-binding protein
MAHKPHNPAAKPKFFSVQVSHARRFYLDLNPPPHKHLSVVSGGVEHCTAQYRIQRKTFPYYSIEFVAGGKGSLKLGSKKFALFPGRIFTYGPGITQQITTDPKDLLVKYFVDFAGSDAKRLLDGNAISPGTAACVATPNSILTIFDELTANGLAGSRFSSRICEILTEYLILKIAESIIPEGDMTTSAFGTYRKCRDYIRENLTDLKSLSQIADRCHIDQAYLCRLFRRFDHRSPYQYLMRLKMNAAAEQLRQPGVLVKEVACRMGFNDPFHFSRAFKNVFGLSPDAFNRLR